MPPQPVENGYSGETDASIMNLYTIGHSVADMDAFLGVLQKAGIEVIVDVRSKPASRFSHFNQGPLERALIANAIAYEFMGHLLGGIPKTPEIAELWKQGQADARILLALRSSEGWREGIGRLTELLKSGRSICLMCSERDPTRCHRTAVALDLTKRLPGLRVLNLAAGKPVSDDVGIQEVLM
jgi:uncharacterized protein (DUF488 family)